MPKRNKPLTIWLVQDGEQIPLIEGSKPMRTWQLGSELAKQGHKVIWWAANFHHIQKKKICNGDQVHQIDKNFEIRMLDCGSYHRNLSLARILFYMKFGRRLRVEMRTLPKPDRIVASYPSIEGAYESVKYGKEFSIPTIVDVRDMWPDTFMDYLPRILKPVIKLYIFFYQKKLRYIFGNTTRLVSMSQAVLSWAQQKIDHQIPGDVFYLCPPKQEITHYRRTFSHDILHLIFIGTFGATYDLITLCDAILKAPHSRVKLTLIGDGEQGKYLRKKYANIKEIEFTGWLKSDEITPYVQKASVGVLPLKNLAIPNKFGEYLSYGLPVISSIKGELAQILQKEELGLSYDCGSVNSLVECIKRLNKKNLSTFAKNAERFYLEKFDAANVYSQYIDVVENTKLTSNHSLKD